MRLAILLSALLATTAANATARNLTITVGPEVAPVGGEIQITYDTDQWLFGGGCPFYVYDSDGNYVFPGPCDDTLWIPPGTTTWTWDQTTIAGTPAPPGVYTIVAWGQTHYVTIDPEVDAALVPLGVVRTGLTRPIALSAPGSPGHLYQVVLSAAPVGFPTCSGIFRHPWRALTFLGTPVGFSDSPFLVDGPFLRGEKGRLDVTGHSSAPSLTVPDDANLVGTSFFVTFATFDPETPCLVTATSKSLPITIE